MAQIEESIDVAVPVSTAYNQWTQFEEFPKFMEGVEEIRQLDDTHLHWRASIGGMKREWDAEITEQHPDHRIAWRSTTGATNAGVVTFHRLDDSTTRVMLQLDTEPEGLVETAGDALGFVRRRVRGDLERFKTLIEVMGQETGGWRGEVDESAQSGQASSGRFARGDSASSETGAGVGAGSASGGLSGGGSPSSGSGLSGGSTGTPGPGTGATGGSASGGL